MSLKPKTMAIGNAIKLIKTIDSDNELRDAMYKCKSTDELYSFMKERGFGFTFNELVEAINSLHVQCQTLIEAQELMHKAELLKFLFK